MVIGVDYRLYLGFGLDGSTVFQQDLNDAKVTIPGCTVERRQLILQTDEWRKRDGKQFRQHVIKKKSKSVRNTIIQ